MGRFPDEETTIIVLCNNGMLSATNVGDALAAIVFGAPYELPAERKVVAVDIATLQKYVGDYRPPQASLIKVTLENGKLMRQAGARSRFEMFATSDTEFFIAGSDLKIRFDVDSDGRVVSQTMRSGDREVVAAKIK